MRSLFTILTFITAVAHPLLAQNEELPEVWSIDQCVSYALQNNIQIRQAQVQKEIAANTLSNAKWDRTPNLNFNGSYGANFGLNIDPVTNTISQTQRQTANFGLSSSWVLFNGMRKYNYLKQSNLDFLAAMYSLEDVKNDIRLNVASAYLQILLNQEILLVATEQQRITALQLDRMGKLVTAGSRPKGDQLQLEAQLARDQQNFIASQNSVTISKLQLANILQLENPDDFTLSTPEIEVPESVLVARNPESIFSTAVAQQPGIKGAEKRLESSEKAVEVSKGNRLPTLSLNAQMGTTYSDQIQQVDGTSDYITPVPVYDADGNVVFVSNQQTVPTSYSNKPFGNQLSDNLNEYVGVSLNIPIFNRLTIHNGVETARLNRELSQLQLDQEKNNLRQTIYQAHADAKASYNSFLAAEKAVESSEESFTYAEQRFEVGALNQFDYENAKNSLASAQSDLARAKYDYIFKIKVLEFYLTNQVKL